MPPLGAALMAPLPAAPGLPPSRRQRLHFNVNGNEAFIIPFHFHYQHGLLPIILYRRVRQYQLQDLAISFISNLPQVLLGAGTLCALGQEIAQDK